MFKLVTDSTADLPVDYLKQNEIACINLSYILDGVTYGQGKELEPKAFFDMMRQGKMPTTSQVNPEEASTFLEKLAQTEKEILYLAFSSGLSGSYNSAAVAAQEVMERHPDCKIRVLDSLCASMGEGLFVYKAVQLRAQGKSMDEVTDWLEEHKLEFVHVFTVDDLFHLYRGGRVSKTTAVVGTLAGIKPMLHVDDEGHLINIAKVRGRKKSLTTLVDYMEKKTVNYTAGNDMVMISHGDALEDAEFVRDQIRERLGVQNFMINSLGPVIGTHTGPGLIALFFMGESR
ncbi:MAG: DegV family protein [Clostridium sp.]|nr:DegV family protein [Acetatifactor muris]MCM1526485.1 DegV family protein [Bacteroides sp.]MCM1562389.1 DegV family protein [Clostridium sp.]